MYIFLNFMKKNDIYSPVEVYIFLIWDDQFCIRTTIPETLWEKNKEEVLRSLKKVVKSAIVECLQEASNLQRKIFFASKISL